MSALEFSSSDNGLMAAAWVWGSVLAMIYTPVTSRYITLIHHAVLRWQIASSFMFANATQSWQGELLAAAVVALILAADMGMSRLRSPLVCVSMGGHLAIFF